MSLIPVPPLALCVMLCGAANATAQCLSPNLGLPTGSATDTITVCGPLGFDFVFPGGQSVSAIAIDSNGRLFPIGADNSDDSPTVTELETGPRALMPLWSDLGLSPTNNVHCFTNTVDTAVFTWVDCQASFGPPNTPFTFQVELHADGSFRFAYDERLRVAGPVGFVGYSAGDSSTALATDWVDSLLGPAIDSGPARIVYAPITTELSGAAIDFTPNGMGGYVASTTHCDIAFATERGEGCTHPTPTRALTFTRNFAAGYDVQLGDGSLTTIGGNFGSSMGHGDNTLVLRQLGFTILFPDDTPIHMIDVDSNGRILVTNTGFSDTTPSVGDLTIPFHGQIDAFWSDLDPSAGGDVFFATNNTDLAIVTWVDVPQHGVGNSITVQVQLRSDDSITIVLEDTTSHDPSFDLIVGVAGGFFGGTAESDFTLPIVLPSPSELTHFEFFDSNAGEIYDLQRPPASATLHYDSLPILGTTFDLTLDGMMPTHQGAFLMFGFSDLSAHLGAIFGIDCTLYSDNAVPALMIGAPGQTSASYSLPIASLGTPLVLQGAVLQPGINALGLDLSNAVDAMTGL